MLVVGIDLGSRRIGVAVSDSGGRVAVPRAVIRVTDPAEARAQIASIVAEVGAERVVVGLPLSLDGRRGPAAQAALDEVGRLAKELPVPVETWDERLTTVTAARVGPPARARRAGRGPRDGRNGVDAAAAAVLLQSFLDARR